MAKKKRTTRKRAAQIVSTLGEVAKHFDRSLNTVRKDWRPAWPDSCGARGAWNLAEIAKWRAEQQERSDGAEAEPDQRGFLRRKREAEARIKEAEARRRERENRLAEDRVVLREDVETFLAGFFRFTRDGHKRLVREAKGEFPRGLKQQLADSLEQRCSSLLAALHAQAQRLAEITDA